MKRLYITAARKNDGKTLVTLGLTAALASRVRDIGFIKPLGMRDLKSGTVRIDQDTLLIDRACKVHCNIQDMSPVTVSWEFMKEYLRHERRRELMSTVLAAFGRVSEGKDLVVVEGTGNAAIGSVFGLSNAEVAAALDAKVVLVVSGGIGHPIDEVLLNQALFQRHGVPLVGVIINRVYPHERQLLDTVGRKILEERGVPILGLIPEERLLERPTVMQVLEQCRGELLAGDRGLSEPIDRVMLGAMSAAVALERVAEAKGNIFFVTPGDRVDLILPVVGQFVKPREGGPRLVGILLSGGIRPRGVALSFLRNAGIPVILHEDDSFTVASAINAMQGKISPDDQEKIELAIRLVTENVDCEKILELL